MDKLYNEALKKIKKLNRLPSVKEWNEIAKKEGYLSSSALVYISQKNFKRLCIEIRK